MSPSLQRLTRAGMDLVLVDVNTGVQTSIVWPYGFVARLVDGKAVLVAPDGSVVAREGDLLDVGGGFAQPGFHVCDINGKDIRQRPNVVVAPFQPQPSSSTSVPLQSNSWTWTGTMPTAWVEQLRQGS